ncbi:MAG: RNA polymerase subunit sigma-70 [Acidobacteria bacterium]|nr:MAG: RNA polymerase subunit sigma-70 [Acidobacteriota bacterium]
MPPKRPDSPGEITGLLIAWRGGDRDSFDRLFPLVYGELRLLARRQRRRAAHEPGLDTTGLIHEVYLRLVDQSRAEVQDRHHFFALAAKAMRHILVDDARHRGALKRGGAADPVTLDDGVAAVERGSELMAVDEALARLEAADPRLGRIVELRFFGGLSVEETAETLDLSPRTVKRDWQKARAFLYHELERRGAT